VAYWGRRLGGDPDAGFDPLHLGGLIWAFAPASGEAYDGQGTETVNHTATTAPQEVKRLQNAPPPPSFPIGSNTGRPVTAAGRSPGALFALKKNRRGPA